MGLISPHLELELQPAMPEHPALEPSLPPWLVPLLLVLVPSFVAGAASANILSLHYIENEYSLFPFSFIFPTLSPVKSLFTTPSSTYIHITHRLFACFVHSHGQVYIFYTCLKIPPFPPLIPLLCNLGLLRLKGKNGVVETGAEVLSKYFSSGSAKISLPLFHFLTTYLLFSPPQKLCWPLCFT